jgi:hypothetical protein
MLGVDYIRPLVNPDEYVTDPSNMEVCAGVDGMYREVSVSDLLRKPSSAGDLATSPPIRWSVPITCHGALALVQFVSKE